MKLPRPFIPVDVRLQVIARQLQEDGRLRDLLAAEAMVLTKAARLRHLLQCKFEDERVHLDHEPPLCLRDRDETSWKYTPDANDPEFLVYRTEAEHRIKTFVRGDGAQRSDAAKRRRMLKERRQDRPRPPNRWPPKGSRKLTSRSKLS